MDQFHVDICSADSLDLYPSNTGCDFWVGLDEALDMRNKQWHVALVGLTVVASAGSGANLSGKEIFLYSNVADFSVLGGKKTQLLRKVCLGSGVQTATNSTVFSVDTVENYCFYKRVQHQEIKSIHVVALTNRGEKFEALGGCLLSVTLHFKRHG
jgi:hypothetical protein